MTILSNNIYEKRLTSRLKLYWDMIKGNEDVPLSSKFSSGSISDIWDNCISFKVSFANKKPIYHTDYIGRNLQKAFNKDLSNAYFSSVERSALTRDFVSALDQSVGKRGFINSEGSFVNAEGRLVKFRDCIMPFKDNSGEIDSLILGVSWRSFE